MKDSLRSWLTRWRPQRGGSRVVMIIGNEGAVLVRMNGRSIAERRYVPMPDPDGAAMVNEVFHADRRAPVTVLLDVLEQHYREATIPNVNWNDRRKLLNRKLELTYGDDHLTTSLRLSADGGIEGETARRSERKYFLIGVPLTEELRAWLDIVVNSGNPVEGMALLPVEAVSLIRDLAPEDSDPDDPPTWQIMVTHNRASGFRQVILKRGELIFTRLTPNPETDAGTDDLVENIQTEVRSTMTYLRRLSFTDADRMDLLTIAEGDVAAHLDPRRMRTRHARTLTPEQAAETLGLNLNRSGLRNASDDLIAAWYARQPVPRLRLDTPRLLQARILGRVPAVAYTLAASIAVAALAYGGWQQVALGNKQSVLADLQARKSDLLARREALVAARPADQPPLRQVALVINTHRALARRTPVYTPAVGALTSTLPADLAVTKLAMVPEERRNSLPERALSDLPRRPDTPGDAWRNGAAADGAKAPGGAPMIAEATVRYLGDLRERERIAGIYERYRDRLAARLPDHGVRMTQRPFGSEPDSEMAGDAGVAAGDDEAEEAAPITGVYRIEGPR
jgi:hypothetical protein